MIGAVTFATPASYCLPRAYQWIIGINAGEYLTDNPTPGVYHLYAPGAIPYVKYTFKLFDAFVGWSTAAYTLDHVLEECYYSFPPFTDNNPADVVIGLDTDVDTHHLIIRFAPFGYLGEAAKYPLAGAPSGYWNQPGFPG